MGVREDIPAADLEALAPGIRGASALLWRITGGTMYIKEASIEDASGDRPMALVYDATAVSPPWSPSHVGPPCWNNAYALLHEICHAELALPDEYGDDGTCVDCIMGGSLGKPAFCTRENHKDTGKACRDVLIGRYPKLKQGFERVDKGDAVDAPPETDVAVTNRGR